MKLPNLTNRRNYRNQAIVAAAGLVLLGCSSSSPNAGAPAAASQSTEPKASAKSAPVMAASTRTATSVFTIDKNSRDPFFPNAKPAVEVVEPTHQQSPASIDVPTLLRQGFQGVIGSGETRIALINNVMLEPGRQTVIPIHAAGQSRNIPVRCREVLRDSVVLEVQGYAQPVKIAKVN
jgi:hypothetical protein